MNFKFQAKRDSEAVNGKNNTNSFPEFVLFPNGGGGGIRTPVGLHPNGFQDRLVMTASIRLRVCVGTRGRADSVIIPHEGMHIKRPRCACGCIGAIKKEPPKRLKIFADRLRLS